MVLRALALGFLALAASPARGAKPQPCAAGAFLVTRGDSRLRGFGATPITVLIDAQHRVSIADCPAVDGHVRASKRFTSLRARRRNCAGAKRVGLDGRIAAPGCFLLRARIAAQGRRAASVTAARSSLFVTTAAGFVRGAAANGVRSFLGIPYAAPPVGDRRWRPPAPALPWRGARDATTPGSVCPQFISVASVKLRQGAEDCLFLNVFTPDPPPARAPVMVWIHGGAFDIGDGRQVVGGTDGDVIARKTGTIVVTLNYRLAELGFLAHHALSAEDPAHPGSGNYGIEDQIAALRWVRDNIAAFGGDPGDVTIFGESAGGWSVCAHLVSPRSAGLFQRAIVESGLCVVPMPTLAASEAQGDLFASRLGCGGAADVAACMRSHAQAEVEAALPPDPNFIFMPGLFGHYQPTLDGFVFREQFAAAFAAGRLYHVPVLIGSNRDEGTLFVVLARDAAGMPVMASEYPTLLRLFLADDAQVAAAMATYPLADYPTPGAALAAAFGDAFLACPTIRTAHLLASQVPTYLYQFEYAEAPFALPVPAPLGAYHSSEIQYVFGKRQTGSTDLSPVEQTLSAAIMGYWTRFAARADPNGDGTPRWPPLDAGDRHLVLDTSIRAATGAKKAQCDFWATLDYLRPALP